MFGKDPRRWSQKEELQRYMAVKAQSIKVQILNWVLGFHIHNGVLIKNGLADLTPDKNLVKTFCSLTAA